MQKHEEKELVGLINQIFAKTKSVDELQQLANFLDRQAYRIQCLANEAYIHKNLAVVQKYNKGGKGK